MRSFTDSNNKETTFSTFISIWYVMTCISGEVGSCASRAIDLRFEGATSLSNFEGSSVAIIAERASTVLGKPWLRPQPQMDVHLVDQVLEPVYTTAPSPLAPINWTVPTA